MDAFLASKTVDHISDYSQRGRIYGELSDEELLESWQSIWNELATDAFDDKSVVSRPIWSRSFLSEDENRRGK